MLSRGDRIGDWIVDAPLGEGGMGSVYRCHSVLSVRLLAAVKVLRPRASKDGRERFLREVEALSSLRHPAVVGIVGFGEDPARGLYFLAMELLEGQDLLQRLIDGGALPPPQAATLFTAIGAALQFAHERSIFHRDIKPANIMVCRDGRPRLLDFGIAYEEGRSRLTHEGTVPGTLAYMAPEAFGGDRPDPLKADIYAFGLVLYEALSGEGAFRAPSELSPREQWGRLIGAKLTPRELDPGPSVPQALRTAVLYATAFAPADRPGSLRPILTELGRCLPRIAHRTAPATDPADESNTRWFVESARRAGTPESGGALQTAHTNLADLVLPAPARGRHAPPAPPRPLASPPPAQSTYGTMDPPPREQTVGIWLEPEANMGGGETVGIWLEEERPRRRTRASRRIDPRFVALLGVVGLLGLALAVVLLVTAARHVFSRPSPSTVELPPKAAPLEPSTPGSPAEIMAEPRAVVPSEPAPPPAGRAPTRRETTPPVVLTTPVTDAVVAEPARLPAIKKARLNVNVRGGWGEVSLDGVNIGTTPVFGYELAPGRHTLRVKNDATGLDIQQTITPEPGEVLAIGVP